MEIKEVKDNKKQFLSLLLLADEQENMIDKYIDRGIMYVLDDEGIIKAECIITDEQNGVLEIKNLAVKPEYQRKGYGKVMIDFIIKNYKEKYSILQVGTGDLGSHTMFIGEITDMEVLSDIPSLTYEYYQNNIKPKPQAVGKKEDGQTIWRCRICGYEYVGEELPDDFICPLCKHPASDFEKVVKRE